MRPLIYAIGFLVLSNVAIAQEDQPQKKWKIEGGLGLNVSVSGRQMASLMKEYNFDIPSGNWFWGGTSEHPHYSKPGCTLNVTYYHSFKQRSQLGIRLNYAWLTTVYGNSNDAGYLFVRFSNFSLVPVYSFKLNKNWEFEAGPTLLINSGNKTSHSGTGTDKYTKLTYGLLAGFRFKIWDSSKTYGKIGSYCLVMPGNKMGPYTALGTEYIPESKIDFSNLNICFSVGLKL